MERCAIGIEQIDESLNGGLPRGHCVLMSGTSGVGKTIFAMQFLFNGYSKFKETGIYLTTTEPVIKALNNLKGMSFFSADLVDGVRLHFSDLRRIMKDWKMDSSKPFTMRDVRQLVEAIERMIKVSGAKRAVIDSITAICYLIHDKALIREFIFELGNSLNNLGCTTLLTSEVLSDNAGNSSFGVEEFISDGILKLTFKEEDERPTRIFNIVKMRGTSFFQGPIPFKISDKGLVFFTPIKLAEVKRAYDEKVKTGIRGFDRLVEGGIVKASTTLISGPSGTGKTILSLQFLSGGALNKEKGMFITFEEPESQIVKEALHFSFISENAMKKNIKILSIFPENALIYEHLINIKNEIERFKPSRLVIDSLSSMEKVFSKKEVLEFIKRLGYYLKSEGITAWFTHSSSSELSQSFSSEYVKLSTVIDNIILLRYVELDSEMKRFLTVLKVRDSNHDKGLREYKIDKKGVQVENTFKGVKGIMTGTASRSIEEEKIFKAFQDLSSNIR